MMFEYTALFLVSTILSLLLGFPVRKIALFFDVVDRPEKRKMHPIPVPLMGGMAIYGSFAAISLAYFTVINPIHDGLLRTYLGMMAGATVVLLLGIYDDVVGVKPLTKFAGQTLAALVVVALGARIYSFTNPLGHSFHIGWLGIPLAVLWIVGVTNAVNLIDGLDGLAAGIGCIAAAGLFAIAAPQNAFVASATIILAGAILGFLKHNFYPARLFLGDTGSMLIGFLLAVIGLNGSLKATTATVLFLPIIVLGVPILDTLFAIFRRARRRVSPFKPDREHIHHRLVRIGLHHRNVVLVMYFVCAYLALTAYSIAQFPYQTALLFVVLLMMGGVIGLRTVQFVEERLEMVEPASRTAMVESHAGPKGGARNGRRPNGSLLWGSSFSTLLCEVRGFRADFGEAAELRALCSDISSMLSRRMRVHSVRAEPSAPGNILLILRTESVRPSMAALVQDGVAWYLEDQRERLSTDGNFPSIQWIQTAFTPGGNGDSAPMEDPEIGEETGAVRLREGSARLVNS